MASKSTKKPPTSIIPGDESRRRREGTAGRRARALRSILSFTFLLSIFAVTHASASCRKRASSALTSDGVRRSSALDQASVSCTSKAAWTCVRVVWCVAVAAMDTRRVAAMTCGGRRLATTRHVR